MDSMNVGLNTLYDIGSSYSIKLNEKETLVYEEDETSIKNPQKKKLEEEQENKAQKDKEVLSSDELSEDEERLVKDLQSRDSEVRAHEAAHQAAGGGITGAASYTYQQGPDGKMYAIGGEVSISMSTGSTPQETITNARKIAAAAMAPGNPSPQDYSVAASARVMEMKAQQQLAKQQQEEMSGISNYTNQLKENDKTLDTTKDISNQIDISA